MTRARTILTVGAAAAVAAWLGLRLWPASVAVPAGVAVPARVAVPAGETSAPTAADRVSAGSLAAAGKIPAQLPAFTLNAPDGKPLPIETFKGRSLVINFWATWCGPCRKEIPLLESVAAAQAAHGLTVVGVAVDRPAAVAGFARRFGISYPLMTGEQDALAVATALGVAEPVFPFTVFTDRRQRIVALYLGELHRPQLDLILSVVHGVNAGRIGLPAARDAIATGLAHLNAA